MSKAPYVEPEKISVTIVWCNRCNKELTAVKLCTFCGSFDVGFKQVLRRAPTIYDKNAKRKDVD